ncbi:MAG: iron-sulfur cluster insertion protein ErpA [Alphaproteobacteria bacterium]|nr:iron-sulfur cluster insertion protein ErpA [Alphaproteobacteria bacterium]
MTTVESAIDRAGTDARSFGITESAARQLTKILESEEKPGMMLRVSVSGGGCSGFQYGFTLDDSVTEDDLVFTRDGIRVVIDDMSLDLLAGAEVDFVEELIGASFQVKNPNATSSCGCGASFAI